MTPVHTVFADVDTGIDDALALIYLLASPDATLVGIASTAGNVAVDQVCANNLGLLEMCGAAEVPVSRGADQPLSGPLPVRREGHGPKGLGHAELPPAGGRVTDYDAATAWVRAARAHRGELIGLATAPLTNLALALRAEPELPTLLRRLVIMGGSYPPDSREPEPEWNSRVDPTAAAEVFAAFGAHQRLPIVCGLNVTRQVAMTPQLLAALSGPAAVHRFLQDAMRFYFEVHRDRGVGYLAYMHDPLAAAVALDPALIETRTATVDFADVPTADWTGARKPNARIGIRVNPAVFFERLIARVAPFRPGT